jgi:hypothetical protein
MKSQNLVVLRNLTEEQVENWKKQFVRPGKTSSESIWRRSQESYNAKTSGWKSEFDIRRRMLQYKYDLALEKKGGKVNLVCKNFYIWLNLTLPKNELENFITRNKNILKNNKYVEKTKNLFIKNKIKISFTPNKYGKLDLKNGAKEKFEKNGYANVLVLITNYNPKENEFKKIWDVLDVGYRKILKPGIPKVEPLTREIIEKYLPAEVEIGSGGSYEIGVMPLHNLHHYFYISDENKMSYFGGDNDNLLKDFTDNEEKFLQKTCGVITTGLKVKEGIFHKNLAKMYEAGKFIGKINVNSFDGLHLRSGTIKENYLRKYQRKQLRPTFKRQKKSKALFVIGLHADRRQTQQQAREQGLQIIHIDSEGFLGDKLTDYKKESMQDSDILIRAKASEFGKILQDILKK